MKLLLTGEPELDVKTDKEDILMAGALEEEWVMCVFEDCLSTVAVGWSQEPCILISVMSPWVLPLG
jgi:hypothetical protein